MAPDPLKDTPMAGLRRESSASRPGAAWLLFPGLLLLNAFLVSPSIGWYDEGEMVGTTVCLGISHPSGQALFHLLGKVFLFLPFGTPAWRLGLMSAACSALASVLFWTLGCRLAVALSDEPAKAPSATLKIWMALLTLAWSLSGPWWTYSLTPLVYALHLLLGLLLLWALSLERPGRWPLALFILGVATVFRPTQFFALPFMASVFLWKGRGNWKRTAASLPFLAVFFALGRSTALYLPLRSALHPAMEYANLTHPLALLRQVFALKFSNSVGANSLGNVLHVAVLMLERFWGDLTVLGVALILWGIAAAFRKRARVPDFFWVAMGWGLLEALFVLTIPFPTFEPHQVLLGWAYSGLAAALSLARLEGAGRRGLFRPLLVHLLLAAFVAVQLFSLGRLLDRKRERGAQDYARDLLTIMAPRALYVPAEENEYFPVAGYQQSFGFRKDVEIAEPGAPPSRVQSRIGECLKEGRPLYVTRKWALPPGWGYRAWGPLLQVERDRPAPAPPPAPRAQPVAAWGGVELSGVEIRPARVEAGGIVQVTYRWVRRKPSREDASDLVVALFIDARGNYWKKKGVFWLHDIHGFPAGAPARMKPGRLYEDKRILFIPSGFPPGEYALAVGLQRREPAPKKGRESFDKAFYERQAAQDLDKFMGRGEEGAVAQFSAGGSPSWKEGLWPVTKSRYPIADPRFVPVAELQIVDGTGTAPPGR